MVELGFAEDLVRADFISFFAFFSRLLSLSLLPISRFGELNINHKSTLDDSILHLHREQVYRSPLKMSNTADAVSSSPPWQVVLRRNGWRNELLFSQVNT